MNLKQLSRYTKDDLQKMEIIDSVMHTQRVYASMDLKNEILMELHYEDIPKTKFCPECGRTYPESENFCFDCLVKLKQIRNINVKDIKITPGFNVKRTDSQMEFEEILTQDNLDRISQFDFKIKDYKGIIKSIKSTVLKTLDGAIKENEIHLDSLAIENKILLFSKSFVEVDFKSYGAELGYFEFNRIYVDDRQLPVLMITTLLHELSHFLLKEIIAEILCLLLDCAKTSQIESIAVFILSYTPINRLMDEYAAHTVEGRFTLFGYQDYSSFLNIQKELDMPEDEIDMIKTIANSFSTDIKEILEAFIDDSLLEDIKEKFRSQIMDEPDYKNLLLENCTLLNSTGMLQAIKWIVEDGFMISMENIETLREYDQHWK